jgi:predicted phosphodiesterase
MDATAAMRIAVISDIHANHVALQAALEDLARQDVDRTVCLGDAVQGGCEPRQVADRLREIGCPVILGNADAFVLSGVMSEGFTVSEEHRRVRDWTVEQLGPRGLDLLRTFVPTYEIELDASGTLLCFHGSPRSYDDVLLPDTPEDDLRATFDGIDANVLCGGHTHLQWTLQLGAKTFFNPGSIGLAYNRHSPRDGFRFFPLAEYAVLSVTPTAISVEHKHVLFDVDALDRVARASGHPFAETVAARYRPSLKA